MKFTVSEYKKLLKSALNNDYRFISYTEMRDKRSVILRHDIDGSLSAAYAMSRLERSMGIKSTYFIMIKSSVYNLFSDNSIALVKKIIANGHDIGLHFHCLNKSKNILVKLLTSEIEFIESIFHIKIRVVSFHQPSTKDMNMSLTELGLINSYSIKDVKDFKYISDSNKVWREQHPDIIFKNQIHQKLQLLIHPMWWMSQSDDSTDTCWNKVLLDNFKLIQNYLIKKEGAYGKKRQFVIK